MNPESLPTSDQTTPEDLQLCATALVNAFRFTGEYRKFREDRLGDDDFRGTIAVPALVAGMNNTEEQPSIVPLRSITPFKRELNFWLSHLARARLTEARTVDMVRTILGWEPVSITDEMATPESMPEPPSAVLIPFPHNRVRSEAPELTERALVIRMQRQVRATGA